MPAEVPERVAVVETQQQHYADELRELKREMELTREMAREREMEFKREMALLRKQLDEFVRDALPVIKAVQAQQQAKARAWNTIAMKAAEVSLIAFLGWVARGVYLQATQDVAQHIESNRNDRR